MAIKTINDEYLSAIGAAIREKTGTEDTYKPKEMAAAILTITGGGGSGEVPEIPAATGNCSHRFAYNAWNWALELYGNQMSTNNITSALNMFYESDKIKKIPFDLNFQPNGSNSDMGTMFYFCKDLTEIPAINNAYPGDIGGIFDTCVNVRYLPEDLGDNWNWDRLHTYAYAGAEAVFDNCHSLRKIPDNFLKNFYNIYASSYSSMYYNTFSYCYNLDELCGLQVSPATFTSNCFQDTFRYCHRLKRMTFAMNEDGTPKTANWKNQTIDLASEVGYCSSIASIHQITGYNSGITADKEIIDTATYQALKNDPDSWTKSIYYSRYNAASAIETINSLPDTSAYLATAGGTNTIKFKSTAGSFTDAGSMISETTIAAAAAKGWTVSLV